MERAIIITVIVCAFTFWAGYRVLDFVLWASKAQIAPLKMLSLSNKSLAPIHEHKWIIKEKCGDPGCGSYCECGAFKEITTGIVFKSKNESIKYFRFDDWTQVKDIPEWLINSSREGYSEVYIINIAFMNTSYVSIGIFKKSEWYWYNTGEKIDPVHKVTHFRSLPEGPKK